MSEEEIFYQARALRDPEDRAAYLRQACGGDAALRASIEELLRADVGATGFLESPPPDPDTTADVPNGERPGTVIGPYKLLQEIGAGGMGTIFMAEQVRPVRRLVALKLVRPGLDSRQILARFEAERQALAMMDHPNIARVLDAGTTPTGHPYFVMELVKGIPITDYCDQNQLGPRQRLELFVPVCQAVQHAHQKGVIHRDLKPSNILVARYDDVPAPKVIDFGVAKATGPRLTERTLFTQFGQLVGTLEYMSPEQAAFNALDIDTRSDIYSLGVLLYELLTGSPPFSREDRSQAGMLEMLRVIREQEPTRPSMKLSTADALPTLAANRGTEPAKLTRLVRGELDWIVMKALEKDRNRRYETANGFAMDLQRYLADEPIVACAPSAAYRFRKFARRNRTTLVPAAAGLATVLVGLATSTFLIAQERDAARDAARRESQAAARERLAAGAAEDQRAQAERERQRAETNFRRARDAVDRVFTLAAEKMADEPHLVQIRRALLEDALEFYQGFLEQKGTDPLIRHETARAYLRVGNIQLLLGRLHQTEEPLRQAITLLERLAADYPSVPEYRSDLAAAHDRLGVVYAESLLRRPQECLEHTLAALAITRKLAADFPNRREFRSTAAYHHTTAALRYFHDMRNARKGEEFFRGALAAWQEIEKETPDDPAVLGGTARAHWWLGALLLGNHRFHEAERELRRALALRDKGMAGRPADTVWLADHVRNKAHLARLLFLTGKPAEAEPLLREAIVVRERMIQDHPDYYDDRRALAGEFELLGDCLLEMGRTEEAERTIRRRLATRQNLAADFPDAFENSYALAWSFYALGLVLQDTDRPQEAVEAFRDAKKLFEEAAARIPGAGPNSSTAPAHALAWMLADCPATQFRDPARAVELAKQALQFAPQSGRYWSTLGVAQYRASQPRDAIASLQRSRELSSGGDSHHWFILAMAHRQLGHEAEAHKWFDQAVKWMEKNQPRNEELRRYRAEAREMLGLKGE